VIKFGYQLPFTRCMFLVKVMFHLLVNIIVDMNHKILKYN